MLNSISTDCPAIDKVLNGGIPTGSVSLTYGEAETGKTTLAIQCAANCAKQGYKTLFVDCDGTFSVQRLSQIASGKIQDIIELIVLMRPATFDEQGTVVDQLADYLTRGFGLVVFDAFTSLYRAEVAERPKNVFRLNRELNRQMACLSQIVKMKKVAVLITGQVHSVFDEACVKIEPVATRVLKFWADIIINVKPAPEPQMIEAVLTRRSNKPPLLTCHLKIQETGIH